MTCDIEPLVFPPAIVGSLPPLRRYGSSLAVNLAKRMSPGVVALRAAVETWMREVPAAARPGLVCRLRSKNDVTYGAALWELALHAYFRHRGYRVSMNEPVGSGDADLLVEKGSGS